MRIAAVSPVAVLAVSSSAILIRLAQSDGLSSLWIAALRLTLASLILIPFTVLRQRRTPPALPSSHIRTMAASGIFLAAHFASWISSLQYTTVASSVVLVSTGPVWVALYTGFVLRERIPPSALIGVALASCGTVFVALANPSSHEATHPLLGNALALVGGVAVAAYLLLGRRVRQQVATLPYIQVTYAFAALFLLVAAYFVSPLQEPKSNHAYLWVVLLAIFPQAVGHSLYNWMLASKSTSTVAVTTLGEPLGAAILAFFLLNERPTPFVISGAGLILAGVVAVYLPQSKAPLKKSA